jgi:hypothetical protein
MQDKWSRPRVKRFLRRDRGESPPLSRPAWMLQLGQRVMQQRVQSEAEVNLDLDRLIKVPEEEESSGESA